MALDLLEFQTAQCLADLCTGLKDLADVLLWLDASHRDGFVADLLHGLDMHGLRAVPAVQHLALPGGAFTDRMATLLLARFPSLQSLDLSENVALRLSAAFEVPAEQGLRMRSVRLRGCEGLKHSGIVKQLAHVFPRLTGVDFSHGTFSKAMATTVSQALPQLTALGFRDCASVTDDVIKACRLPHLTRLDLSFQYEKLCDAKKLRKITDAGIASISKHLPALEYLCLAYLRQVTHRAVVGLLAAADKAAVPLAELDIRAIGRGRPMTQAQLSGVLDAAGASLRTLTITVPPGGYAGLLDHYPHPRLVNVTYIPSSSDPAFTLQLMPADEAAKLGGAGKGGKGGRGKKAAAKEKDPNAPKRGLSSYMHFVRDVRERITADTPAITFADVGRKAGEMWKALTAEAKKPYEDKAATAKTAYEEALRAYHAKYPAVLERKNAAKLAKPKAAKRKQAPHKHAPPAKQETNGKRRAVGPKRECHSGDES